jgi:hypothetical protein
MKNSILIPLFILPLTFSACKEKEAPTSENNTPAPIEKSTNNTPSEVENIEEPAPGIQGAIIGEIIDSQPQNAEQGDLIGAAAGAIIGHQSGSALEGAAIGGLLGAPPQIEEETENTQRE